MLQLQSSAEDSHIQLPKWYPPKQWFV